MQTGGFYNYHINEFIYEFKKIINRIGSGKNDYNIKQRLYQPVSMQTIIRESTLDCSI